MIPMMPKDCPEKIMKIPAIPIQNRGVMNHAKMYCHNTMKVSYYGIIEVAIIRYQELLSKGYTMRRQFTLEYWQDDGWYVGKLREIPGVFSQGETIDELEKNIQDAYKLMIEDESEVPDTEIHTKEIGVEL